MKPCKPEPGGVVEVVDRVLADAIHAGASDVHLEPTDEAVIVRYRIDGRLHNVLTLPGSIQPNILTRLKVLAGLLTYRLDIPQEGSLSLENGRAVDLRVSTFPTIRGERAAIRILPKGDAVKELGDLGLSEPTREALVRASDGGQGLILVTGPAGSGKTTTLYALLRHLTRTRPGTSFITLEDPIELRLDGVAQIQVTPHGELTYARALRSLLRQDPQVLLIGEIRDAETAAIVTEAALTGHLLLSTMHSGSAVEAIVRLLDMGVAPYQVTSTLRLAMSQRLVRTVCRQCGGRMVGDGEAKCAACLGTCYRGRTACSEVAAMTPALRGAVLARSDSATLAAAVRQEGRRTLAEDAERHLAAGTTTRAEVQAMLVTGEQDDHASV